MDDEDELEQIRRRKLLEMQRGVQDQQELEEQKREQEAERAKRQQIRLEETRSQVLLRLPP